VKPILFKYIGIAPKFKVFLLLTTELSGLTPGEFTGFKGGAEAIKGAGA
jgi:hypothetical protein